MCHCPHCKSSDVEIVEEFWDLEPVEEEGATPRPILHQEMRCKSCGQDFYHAQVFSVGQVIRSSTWI